MALNAATDLSDWILSTLKEIGSDFSSATNQRPEVVLEASGRLVLREAGLVYGYDDIKELEVRLKVARAPKIDLVLEANHYFSQPLSPSRLPRSRALALANLDIKQKFPFLDVGSHLFVTNGSMGSHYVVIRAGVVEPLLAALRRHSKQISSLMIADRSRILPLRTSMWGDGGWRRASTLQQIANRGALALLTVSLLATVAHIYSRHSAAIAELTSMIDTKKEVVGEIIERNKSRNQLMKLQQEARSSKLGLPPTAAILDNLTLMLPDTTWLTELNMTGPEVTFSGYSKDAASLIPTLNSSGAFRDAAFTSQVARVPGQTGERFTIRMIANASQ